jgi:hypothetical protein
MMSGVTDDRVRAGNTIGDALENEVGSCATTTVSNYSTGSIGHHHHHGQDSSGRASSRTVDRHQSMIANRSARRRFIGAPVEKHFPLLDSIYRYFGAKIAIYFAFLVHTTAYTLLPGLLGIPVFVNSVWAGTAQPVSSAFYALFVIFSAYYMVGSWPASEAQLALTFGVIGCEAAETDRPEFYGEKIPSLVDGRTQIYFSPERRGRRKNLNRAVIFTFVRWAPPTPATKTAATTASTTTTTITATIHPPTHSSPSIYQHCKVLLVMAAISAIFFLRYIMLTSDYMWEKEWGSYIGSAANAVQIQIMNFLYGKLATRLTENENYRTKTEHEDSLISKLFMFQ